MHEFTGFLGCRLLVIVLGHRHGRENYRLGDWILVGVFADKPVLDRPSQKKAVKIGVSGDVVVLFGSVVLVLQIRDP